MAILNVTPDSFSDGGHLTTVEAALLAAERALNAGATVLDIGGESTRPGAQAVSEAEELRRVLPVLEGLHATFPKAKLSIDTRKSAVAQAAVAAGARMINDVSGLRFDPALARVAAETGADLVIMHSIGTPETMQQHPTYTNVVAEVCEFLTRQTAWAMAQGVRREQLWVDPGLGFGKTVAHNLALLKALPEIAALGFPVVVGPSRKRFLTLGTEDVPAEERDALTAASLAFCQSAQLVRVHNPVAMAPVVRFLRAMPHTNSGHK